MRGDIALTVRLLFRGTGLAGLVAAVGGLLAVVAVTRPWYLALAKMEMLGVDQSRRVETVTGLPTVPWAWAAFLAGLAALGIGLSVAVDRPYPRSRPTLVVAAAALSVAGIGALVGRREPSELAGVETKTLVALASDLPVGVELELWSTVGVGVYLTLVAAALVAGGAAAARDV